MSPAKAFFKLSPFRIDVTYNCLWPQIAATSGGNRLIKLDLLHPCWLT